MVSTEFSNNDAALRNVRAPSTKDLREMVAISATLINKLRRVP